ncbi:hypothetical protein DMB38_14905 [Streptomyces sp. WAC 06738]|nr:hypothetical protein DMB38_14905 [Streptomyces sp. WAC 06738]
MRSHAPDAATPAQRADGAICQTGPSAAARRPDSGARSPPARPRPRLRPDRTGAAPPTPAPPPGSPRSPRVLRTP